jgi:GGDEF domain-containing protein
MNLCYLFHKTINYPHTKQLFEVFGETLKLDIASQQECQKEYGVYIVDVKGLDKSKSTIIKKLLQDKTTSLIYFILNDSANALFYQLAYMLKVKSIITHKQEIDKVTQLIKTTYINNIYENKSLYVGRFVADTMCYMIFKNKKLVYASDMLLQDFQCNTLKEVETKVCSLLNLEFLFHNNDNVVDARQIFDETKLDIVKSVYKNGEYLVTIDRYDTDIMNCKSYGGLATRLTFIDILKERISKKEKNSYSLMSIKITNFKKIRNIAGKSELESFLQLFVKESKKFFSNYVVFSEYQQDFFVVLFKNLSLDLLEELAHQYYDAMQLFSKQFNFKIDLSLYVMALEVDNLGSVLNFLDDLRKENVSKKDTRDFKLRYIGKFKENMSDKEIIALLFESSYVNDLDLQLVNTYKGMIIDSPTKIIKKDTNAVYVIVKQIQGAVMSITKETIIHSETLHKDIKASVAFIDRLKKVAKLENFKVLSEELPKENIRVDFAKKNNAILSLTGMKISAEILDISVKSLSLQVKKIKMIEKLINTSIEITFTIPTKRTREGEIKIIDTINVSYVDCKDATTCKIVCEFRPSSKYKNIIMEYVHKRQIEIIEELKKMKY